MSALNKLGAVVVLAPVGAAAAIACASESDVELGEELSSILDAAWDAGQASDGGGDGADGGDGDRCSDSGLCIVPAPIDTRINVTSISGSGTNDVWAVGTARTILHYNGALWEKADTIPFDASTFTMRAVWAGGPSDVWVIDGPVLRHSTGWKGPSSTEWSTAHPVPSGGLPAAISGANGAVTVALHLVGPEQPTIVMCRGWGQDELLEPEYLGNEVSTVGGLWSVAMTRPDEAWATSIATVEHPGARVLRAHVVAADGSGDAGLDDGGPADVDGGDAGAAARPIWETEEHDSRTGKNLYGVWGNAEVVWLVGEGGVLRRMTRANVPSRAFENVPSPVTADLRGVFGFDANDVWAVGDDATVIHWDGEAWTTIATPFEGASAKPRLFTVWGGAPNDLWIGGNGVMLHLERKTP